MANDAAALTAEDIERLRGLGLSDAEIYGAVMVATARCFFSKTLDALGAQLDPVYRDLEPALRDAMTVGRPVAEPTSA